MSLEPHRLYAFGDFCLDVDEDVLLRENTALNLTPKSIQVLKILVQDHGHIVEKRRLISEIWEDTYVEDGNLAVNIATLRKVLGDDAGHPKFIETVARRGYRFIGEVSEISAEDRSNARQERETPRPRFWTNRTWLSFALPNNSRKLVSRNILVLRLWAVFGRRRTYFFSTIQIRSIDNVRFCGVSSYLARR